MRFRTEGHNWEGRSWRLAPSLVVLAEQVDAAEPEPEPGDGTVASRAHDALSPNSDHRPRPHDGPGVVRAIDVGETSNEVGRRMVNNIVASRDARLRYIIYEGEAIWSEVHNGRPPWEWQPYGGANRHARHWHLSTKRNTTADEDRRPWQIGEPMTITQIRLELATGWHSRTGKWMEPAAGENPQERLTRIANEIAAGERTLEATLEYAGQPTSPQPLEALPSWVLDPYVPYGTLAGTAPSVNLRVLGEVL